jgi:DNA sulfur modification protein DndB
MTTIPVIKGRLGNTEFYEATMKARELVKIVRPPKEMDSWANFGIEERMQRDPEPKRIKAQIAPYLAKNEDRFFGSVIVLLWEASVEFEPLSAVCDKLPKAYQKNTERMGFLTIEGGTLVVLDGQHRLLAITMVVTGDVSGPYSDDVANDDVCVIFIRHEDLTKTRRIFNVVNRYAKPTTRSDNILTSEDDGYAIVARRLLRDDQPLHARHDGKKTDDIVNWKSNTLAGRSIQLTTISAVYESVRILLEMNEVPKLDAQDRPTEEALDEHLSTCASSWTSILTNIDAYRSALDDVSKVPDLRRDESPAALLFKPAAQIALIGALAAATVMARDSGSKLGFDDFAKRVNQITDWSMKADLWKDIIIKSGGTIDPKADAVQRMKSLLTFLLAADVMNNKHKTEAWKSFNQARHADAFRAWEAGNATTTDGQPVASVLEDLPQPTAGSAFTKQEAFGTKHAA